MPEPLAYAAVPLRRAKAAVRRSRTAAHTRAVGRLLGGETLTLVDVGAAGGIEPRWRALIPHLHYIGIEPDERSRSELLDCADRCLSRAILPFAISDHDGALPIHLCRDPKVSSRYKPNREVLDRFIWPERYDVLETVSVEARTLDSLGIERCQFIKLDIQGGELAALEGGTQLLRHALGVEVEVEFMSLYRGQPLFGDVHAHLSRSGFEFAGMAWVDRWERKASDRFGQEVFGDALFLRSPEWIVAAITGEKTDLRLARQYLAVCLLYRHYDLIEACVTGLRGRGIEDRGLFAAAGAVVRAGKRLQGRLRLVSRLIENLLVGHDMRVHWIH